MRRQEAWEQAKGCRRSLLAAQHPGPSLLHCAVVSCCSAVQTVPELRPHVMSESEITAGLQSAVSEGDLHDIETKITEMKGKEKAKGFKR